MKTSHRASLMAVAVVALGGCASMHEKPTVAANQSVDDTAYIAQVEHMARARGVAVRWVNPPQKRAKDL